MPDNHSRLANGKPCNGCHVFLVSEDDQSASRQSSKSLKALRHERGERPQWPIVLAASFALVMMGQAVVKGAFAMGSWRESMQTLEVDAPARHQQHMNQQQQIQKQQQQQETTKQQQMSQQQQQQDASQQEASQQVAAASQLTNLEEQLMGCRTKKTDPIPEVDRTSSLKVLDTYSDKQRKQAREFTAAVSACKDFACLRKANKLPRAPGQFRFPHFMIIGFPKCATTSIYCHLIQHPQAQYPFKKEPHTLISDCGTRLSNCSAEVQRDYVVDMLSMKEAAEHNFTKAVFEGSTHYVGRPWLAEQLTKELPWLKLIVSLREPVSQAIALHLHNLNHGRDANCSKTAADPTIYKCIENSMRTKSNYGWYLEQWLASFPKERFRIVQYENITRADTQAGNLKAIKSFLEMDTSKPNNKLPLSNFKHQRGGKYSEWEMARWQYNNLVKRAQQIATWTLGLLIEHGSISKAERKAWMQNWERVWQDNFASCEEGDNGNCKIVVS